MAPPQWQGPLKPTNISVQESTVTRCFPLSCRRFFPFPTMSPSFPTAYWRTAHAVIYCPKPYQQKPLALHRPHTCEEHEVVSSTETAVADESDNTASPQLILRGTKPHGYVIVHTTHHPGLGHQFLPTYGPASNEPLVMQHSTQMRDKRVIPPFGWFARALLKISHTKRVQLHCSLS